MKKERKFGIISITSFIIFNNKIMKNIITLMVLIGSLSVSCTQDKPKNVAPADYAETEQKLIQNREQDSLKAAADQTSTTTANGYKMPADSADSSSK